jgi:hypothetical protein
MEAHTQDELRIAQVGNLAHERLVAHRATAQDTPYTKHTTDSDWVMKHGTAMVDLATCAYHDLPKDWKHERDAGAAIAIRAVLQAVRDGIPLDDTFIEQTSELLHNKWLERNMH